MVSFVAPDKGIQCKKELKIIEDCIADSTLDIWCEKNIFFLKPTQYEVHKCFILEFEMAFSAFINSDFDLFHYTLKGIAFCDNVNEINIDNIKDIFESSIKVDKYTSSHFIKYTKYVDGEWYLRD